MPRQKECAANEPRPHSRSLRAQSLRLRVVTQQKFFCPAVMQPAGLPRTPGELAPQLRMLLLPRLPDGVALQSGRWRDACRVLDVLFRAMRFYKPTFWPRPFLVVARFMKSWRLAIAPTRRMV